MSSGKKSQKAPKVHLQLMSSLELASELVLLLVLGLPLRLALSQSFAQALPLPLLKLQSPALPLTLFQFLT